MPVRPLRALAASSLATVVVLAAGAGAASAHVRVSSSDAAPGGFGELTFRVPNESDTASTVSLRVQIPADTPLASVSVKPVPGWSATTTTGPVDPPVEVHGSEVTEAVSEITWTADPGAGIAPGEYQTFSISAGPIPEVDEISFPAIQTYDDGTEQAWIEPTIEGQDEPESPAPVLSLTGGGDAAHGSGTGSTSGASAGSDGAATGTAADATAADDSTDGSGLAVTALVVGVLGLAAGAAALALALASRRRSS
ncbi:YcnI family copper-binding membrane protein [Blastococcus sp. SYSU DS0533]